MMHVRPWSIILDDIRSQDSNVMWKDYKSKAVKGIEEAGVVSPRGSLRRTLMWLSFRLFRQ